MSRFSLYPHQHKALEDTQCFSRVAYYLDMRGGFRQNFCRLGKDGSTK